MILYGQPVVQQIKQGLAEFVSNNNLKDKIVKIFLFSDDKPSQVYVNLKKKFAQDIGLQADIVNEPQIADFDKVAQMIDEANNNSDVVGIVIQLPLNSHLQAFRAQILASIKPTKDIDGLGGVLFGLAQIGLFDFLPATPASVVKILRFYGFDDFEGKNILVIGQSLLVGAPLATYLMSKWAEVISVNKFVDRQLLKKASLKADIIVSATWNIHLIDESFVRDDNSQILIDVGWWIKDGKAVGDVNIDAIKDKVKAYTPVPWWVGPVTVASLFENIKIIHEEVIPQLDNLFL